MRTACRRRHFELKFALGDSARRALVDGYKWSSAAKICRRFYPALTIPTQAKVFGNQSRWAIGRHALLWAERNRSCSNADRHSPDRQRTISAVDALIALQGWKMRGNQRNGACQGPQCAVLDTLKLVDGSVHQSTLARLRVASEGRRETSDDPGLNVVLGEIGLRVAVELGKVGVR